MHTKRNLHILFTILAITIVQVHSDDLMCYVCDDCAKITQETTKQACNAEFFNVNVSPWPIAATTEVPVGTTEPTPPQPSTVGPVETTTLPTPPNPGAAGTIETIVTETTTTPTTSTDATETTTTTYLTTSTTEIGETEAYDTTYMPPLKLEMKSSPIQLRYARAIATDKYNYYCYSVEQKAADNTTLTNRGCYRVSPSEGVCEKLQEDNKNTDYSNCNPCSNSLCNSSAATGASMAAIIMGLCAAALLRSFA